MPKAPVGTHSLDHARKATISTKARKQFQIQAYTEGKSEIFYEDSATNARTPEKKRKHHCNFSLDKSEGAVDNCVHTGKDIAQAEQTLFHLQGKFCLGTFQGKRDLLFGLCNYPSEQTI